MPPRADASPIASFPPSPPAAKLCANPGRSGHKLSLACASAVLDCRNALSEYFGGYGFERTIFTKNCTEALNIAIFGLLSPGDHVVTTCMEHNSVLRPLEFLKKSGVTTYDVWPADERKRLPRRDRKAHKAADEAGRGHLRLQRHGRRPAAGGNPQSPARAGAVSRGRSAGRAAISP